MRFYVYDWRSAVGDAFEADAEALEPRQLGDAPRCPVCRRYVGMRSWLPPYVIDIHVHGRKLGDVVDLMGDLIVSDRFRQAFELAKLTGLEFRPVEVRKVTPSRLQAPCCYYLACVARGRAAIDVDKSGTERGPVECAECRTMRNLERSDRIVIEEGSWEGLDVFVPRGLPGTTMVSERFREMCERSNFTGIILKAAEDFSFDLTPWTKGVKT